MLVTRSADAVPYLPPGHAGVDARRLQGAEAGGPDDFWVARSVLDPGAGVAAAPVAGDTVYVVLSGSLTVVSGEPPVSAELAAGDSAFIPRGEVRSITNSGTDPADTIVVVQPGG